MRRQCEMRSSSVKDVSLCTTWDRTLLCKGVNEEIRAFHGTSSRYRLHPDYLSNIIIELLNFRGNCWNRIYKLGNPNRHNDARYYKDASDVLRRKFVVKSSYILLLLLLPYMYMHVFLYIFMLNKIIFNYSKKFGIIILQTFSRENKQQNNKTQQKDIQCKFFF